MIYKQSSKYGELLKKDSSLKKLNFSALILFKVLISSVYKEICYLKKNFYPRPWSTLLENSNY